VKHHFINERLLPSVGDPDALVVYPHAQRTGGVTLRKRVLATVFGEEHVYNRHYTKNAKRWRNLTDKDLRGYRAYTDLDNYKDIGLTRPCLFIASLRHPLYRAASIYFWVKKKDGHRHQQLAKTSTLEDFYRIASAEHPAYFRNVQCMRVCGEPDASAALDLIREKYVGVGFTNYLAEFVTELCVVLKWQPIGLEGRGKDAERYDAVMTSVYRDSVLEENAEDLKLFEAMSAVTRTQGMDFPRVEPPTGNIKRKGLLSSIITRLSSNNAPSSSKQSPGKLAAHRG